MSVLGIILVLVLLAALVRILARRRPRAKRKAAIRDLLLYCEGDQELAERLMWNEMNAAPEIDFTTAARRAIQRLRRDQR